MFQIYLPKYEFHSNRYSSNKRNTTTRHHKKTPIIIQEKYISIKDSK